MLSVREFVRLVVDPLRLVVLGRSAEGALDISELAASVERSTRDVQDAVGRLRAAGLLTESLELDRSTLRSLAAALPQIAPPDAEVLATGEWSSAEVEILSRFISGSRVTEIPSSLSKRRVVLERLAQEFEPGVRYEEAEVNFTLQLWHPDYAALRRYLVDEGMMTRAEGVYWRTGGRFEPSDQEDS